jgi:hypothetical protein
MYEMFSGATNFCQDLSLWNTSSLVDDIDAEDMFKEANKMQKTFCNLKDTPNVSNWNENFHRAKPIKGARY